MPSNWDFLTIEQIKVIESAANRIKDEFPIKEIIDTFDTIGLPFLYGQPGYYDTLLADTEYNRELIEDYCYDKM